MKFSRSFLLACALSLLVSLFCVSAVAQNEIPQVQLLSGFSYLNTSENSTNQRGLEISSGYNVNSWLTLGADFCHYAGNGAKQTPLPALPGLPSSIGVPFDATTYTIAIGPQFSLRKSKWIVPFVRPGVGLVHESATATQPSGLPFALPLPPAEGEWRVFYGAGGGVEIHHVVPHAAIVVLSDYLRARLFGQDLNSYRVSAGLTWLIGSKQVR